jgi:hypothetical protein
LLDQTPAELNFADKGGAKYVHGSFDADMEVALSASASQAKIDGQDLAAAIAQSKEMVRKSSRNLYNGRRSGREGNRSQT